MSNRIGFVGPADDLVALRSALEYLLLSDVINAIYLGDANDVEQVVSAWAEDLGAEAFLSRAAELALTGNANEIQDLLVADQAVQQLSRVRGLPPPPSRAIEMMEDRIVLVVHSKDELDEEDIANANVIVSGAEPEAFLRRFGPRYFFSPGPLAAGHVGFLERDDDGVIVASVFTPGGEEVWREALMGRRNRISVSG